MSTAQKILNVLLVIGVVIVGFLALSHSSVVEPIKNLGSQVQNDIWYFTGTPIAIQAQGETYAQGGLVEGGATIFSPASSTATTTLTLNSLITGTTVIVNVASTTAQNLFIPGTSTLSVVSGFLPNIGDAETTIIDAASSTAAGLVLTAGAGVTLKFATSTTGTIAAGNVFTVTLVRDTLNTIIGLVTNFK